ncbi:unnamed protein product [Prorocentrum cordatum]|uniref:Uncharacterized protein n=1 Tax=Prorocentrum cordatum TaxID=2364126 RepID=A0ABN9QGD7_9DINO|nr:unnamed protein product [Polarella glacialis]
MRPLVATTGLEPQPEGRVLGRRGCAGGPSGGGARAHGSRRARGGLGAVQVGPLPCALPSCQKEAGPMARLLAVAVCVSALWALSSITAPSSAFVAPPAGQPQLRGAERAFHAEPAAQAARAARPRPRPRTRPTRATRCCSWAGPSSS